MASIEFHVRAADWESVKLYHIMKQMVSQLAGDAAILAKRFDVLAHHAPNECRNTHEAISEISDMFMVSLQLVKLAAVQASWHTFRAHYEHG